MKRVFSLSLLMCSVLAGTLLIAAPAPSSRSVAFDPPAADLTGKWNFAVETGAGSGTPKFEFKQEGEKLTGNYEGQLGSAKLTGTVKGNAFDFKFSVELGEVHYEGTIETDGTVKGKVSLGDLGSGTFTGKRADK